MKHILASLIAIVLTGCASRTAGPGRMWMAYANIAPAPGRELPPLASITTRDFVFPWSLEAAPRTEFTAQTHKGRLHFTFDCDDRDIIVAREWRGESTLDGEDRVEIFFARDAALARYWCIEIDALGRVHDYAARHYRKFDSAWDCPGLRTTAQRTARGYTVTGSIPLASLTKLLGQPVRSGSTIRVGLYRADFHGKTRGEAPDNWLSWVRPGTEKPDFHIPQTFTTLALP